MYNNNFREETTQDLINLLTSHGYECKETYSEYISICPNCKKEKPTLHIKKDKPIFNCFTGGQCLKGNIYTLRELLGITNNSHKNINHKPKETAPATTKQIKTINISLDNLKLIESFPILPKDIKKFEIKRGFKPNLLGKNFISLTDDLITEIAKTNLELSKNLKYYKDKKDYHLIILYKNEYQELETLRLYSFTNKEAKKLTIKGQKTRLYGLEHFSKETKKIVFVEGEEKSEAGNIYRQDKSILFLSISGIGIHAPALEFIEKYPALEYFVMFDNDSRDLEKKAAYSLACKLNDLKENQVRIIELPSIAEKVDLDSYLATFKEHEKTTALTKVLNDSYTISDYQEKNISSIEIEKFERLPPKVTPKAPAKEDITREKKTLDEVRNELPSIIKNHKQGLLLLKLPCGTGKTTAIIKASKERNMIISAPTKELRNEIASKGNFDINLSLDEHCKTMLDNNLDKIGIEESQKLFNERKNISKLGYNNYTTYCKNECKLSNICKSSKKTPKTSTIVETHAKTLLRDSKNFKKDLLVIDESINLKGEITINLAELDRMLWFYDDIHLKQILINIKKFFYENISNLAGKNLYSEFKKVFNNPSLKNLLSALDIETIKTVTINKQYEKLPNKNSLKQLINAIDNKFQSTTFNYSYDGFINHSYLTIDFLKDFNPNIPIINLDATGSINILKKHFPNIEVSQYNPKIELTGINYKAFYHKTFSASNLFDKNLPLKDNEIVKVLEILSKGKKTLVIAPVPVIEKLKLVFAYYDNISFETHGTIKGINDKYNKYDLAIDLPPKIDILNIIKEGKITGDSIRTELCYKDVPTGEIENNKELNVSLWHFKEKYLNELLKQKREALMYQGLFRVKRDTDIKEFITFGNIPLKEYGLIPNEILEVKDIYKKDTPKTHQELRDLIRDFTKEILEKNQFILKSEIYGIYNFLKTVNAETLANIQIRQKPYNIYNILLEKNRNLTNISISAKTIEKKYFYEIVNTSLKELKNECDFLEVSFPLIDKPNSKILLKNDSAFELAKEFYKDSLFIKSPVQAPAENIISTGDKLEADKKEIETAMSYEHIEKLEADIQKLSINVNKLDILELQKIPAPTENNATRDLRILFKKAKEKNAHITYLDNELTFVNLMTFLDNEPSFKSEFIVSSNANILKSLQFQESYYLFLMKKFLANLDNAIVEKYSHTQGFNLQVATYNSIELLMKIKFNIEYNEYIDNTDNKDAIKNDLKEHLLRSIKNGITRDTTYIAKLQQWLYKSNAIKETFFKRTFLYNYIVLNLKAINCLISVIGKLSFDDIDSSVNDFLDENLDNSFEKIKELIAV